MQGNIYSAVLTRIGAWGCEVGLMIIQILYVQYYITSFEARFLASMQAKRHMMQFAVVQS